MSEDGLVECCLEILLLIGLTFFIEWCAENPPCGTVMGMTFLGIMMVVVPVYWFIKECTERMKGSIVIVYFLSFFAWIMAIIVGIVGNLFAILGVCVFTGIGIMGLIYLAIRKRMEKWAKNRKKAIIWELKDQLKALDEQLSLGHITQEEYEQKRKELLEESSELKEKLEYDQKKMELFGKLRESIEPEVGEQLIELKGQLTRGAITKEEYEKKKKELLEKSGE